MSAATLKLYQVDAFTDTLFRGNPAAVCPLEMWLPDATLLAIAAENNLSETAFFVPAHDGIHDYALRWFTPLAEVDLCGHATLAAAYVLYHRLGYAADAVRFSSLSGTLTVKRVAEEFSLDFPVWALAPHAASAEWREILGSMPEEIHASEDWLAVFPDAKTVRSLQPDLTRMAKLPARGVIATAPGEDGIDFVSRAFFPKLGLAEDPVTGSAHCALTPYWAKRLGKMRMRARQISARQGELIVELQSQRVVLTGQARLFLEGMCYVE